MINLFILYFYNEKSQLKNEPPLPCGAVAPMEVVSFVAVTITSFELFDTAVRTCMAGSRSLYPFDRNTLGIQFVES